MKKLEAFCIVIITLSICLNAFQFYEGQELLRDFNSLKKDNTVLQSKYNSTKAEYDALRIDYRELWNSYNSLKNYSDGLLEDYNLLVNKHNALISKYNTVLAKLQELQNADSWTDIWNIIKYILMFA